MIVYHIAIIRLLLISFAYVSCESVQYIKQCFVFLPHGRPIVNPIRPVPRSKHSVERQVGSSEIRNIVLFLANVVSHDHLLLTVNRILFLSLVMYILRIFFFQTCVPSRHIPYQLLEHACSHPSPFLQSKYHIYYTIIYVPTCSYVRHLSDSISRRYATIRT